ncbi:MAG: hypothetical protein ACO2YV_06575 [Pseudomonadales bacterium]|jgi:uncharacterized membrane protein|nr:hypothetical protein [Gammaproteobacteria bacterium]
MTELPAPGARSQLLLEWLGVVTAIAYSLLVASNTGFEFLGFVLLFISSLAIGLWAHRGAHRGILLLQFFYAAAGLIGMWRWYGG